MALDIPMPESPGDSLIKGLNSGSDLMHKMMLNKYYGQLHPSGDVANAMYVQQLRNQYGENDPRYIEAKRAHDLSLQGRESLIGYRNVLNQTAGIRATSPLGKLIAEGKGQGAIDILRGDGGNGAPSAGAGAPPNARYKSGDQYYTEEGDPVGSGSARTPEEQTAYERAINKSTSDATARNILNRAENLDITRKSINPDDLTRYSGLKGTANYLWEAGQAARGNPSQQFLDNQTAVKAASLMSKQMRQFYGDSIQPAATDRLDALANPSTWYKDPKVAKVQWEQLNKILDQETQTYRNKGTSPIKLNKLDFKDGKFSVSKADEDENDESDTTNSGNNSEGSSYDIAAVIPQLMKINPDYTEANIRATAKKRNTTVDNVINQLFQKSVRGQ